MTDRLKGCWVAFDEDIRDDDAEDILNAIGMVRGVAGVSTSVSSPADWIAETRVRCDLRQKLFNALEDASKGKS